MAQYRFYSGAPMPNTSANDIPPITLGLQFSVSSTVRLRAILWWQASVSASMADRTVGLWRTSDGETGTLINGIKTQAVAGTGWQTVTLDKPIILTPGSYVAAVYHPEGMWSVISHYYDPGGVGYGGGVGITNQETTIPCLDNALHGKQNAFIYKDYFAFPDEQFNGSMYGVDILIDNDPIPPQSDIHVYDGNAWRSGSFYVYNGTQWVGGEPQA